MYEQIDALLIEWGATEGRVQLVMWGIILTIMYCLGGPNREAEDFRIVFFKLNGRMMDDPPYDHEFKTKEARDRYFELHKDRWPWFDITKPHTRENYQADPKKR